MCIELIAHLRIESPYRLLYGVQNATYHIIHVTELNATNRLDGETIGLGAKGAKIGISNSVPFKQGAFRARDCASQVVGKAVDYKKATMGCIDISNSLALAF